jgi:hypothetical protein
MVGLFTNFSRLTDKALREYDAARVELLLYVSPHDGPRIGPYLRAIDHMENCVSAVHRAVLNARALRDNKIGRAAPQLTPMQEQRLAHRPTCAMRSSTQRRNCWGNRSSRAARHSTRSTPTRFGWRTPAC